MREFVFTFITIAAMTLVCVATIVFASDPAEKPTICSFTNELLINLNVISLPLDNGAVILKAEELGIMNKGEYGESRFEENISRQTAAKLVSRAMEKIWGISYLPASETDKFIEKISDYNDICNSCQYHVLQLYARGVLKGYEDGSFKGANKLCTEEKNIIFKRLDNIKGGNQLCS